MEISSEDGTLLQFITFFRNEISQLKKSLSAHLDSLEEMKQEITDIKQEHEFLRQKLNSTNRILKQNNVLIFGITEDVEENTKDVVIKLCNDEVDVTLTEEDIKNTYRIGKKAVGSVRPLYWKQTI
ncbi:hypothetical protein JTB14_000627 [Gonioctena quinquepunctata]|nr:hypothetical protein JTB14_000627 [Gonioctena quinquepunctata]